MPTAQGATLEFDTTWQDGFRFADRELSHVVSGGRLAAVSDELYFGGVVWIGNQSAHLVDENGLRDLVILSADSMACVHRCIADDRTIVTRETWTRLAV